MLYRRQIIVLLIVLSLGIACDRPPGILVSSDQKIIGQWRYKRANFREKNALYGLGQIERFQNDQLIFYRNREVEIINQRTGEINYGNWQINVYFNGGTNGDTRVEELQLTMRDESGQVYTCYWEDLTVTYNRVRGRERLPDGIWTYVLTAEP